jgi:hypothetical protein
MINHPNRRRKTAKPAVTSSRSRIKSRHDHEHDYTALLASVQQAFYANARAPHLFLTDVLNLNDTYLDGLPAERQVHKCHACRRFIETYGGLVRLDEDGSAISVMWQPAWAPEFYRPSFQAMCDRVQRARIVSVFHSAATTWGIPKTMRPPSEIWSHIAVYPAKEMIYAGALLTPDQAMAASRENFGTVARALAEFTAPMLDQAIRLFEAYALDRSEKFVGPVKWLRALHDRHKGRSGENQLWRAIAMAPEGYCHPRASVVGPLLNDIAQGTLPFETIKRRFDAMVQPLRYQRPQAAPSAANIAQAEKIVETLGIAPSLERRFARLEELQTIWRPAPEREDTSAAGGVFGHIRPKGSSRDFVREVDLPPVVMTWEKFARTILPSAEKMSIQVPGRGNFIALTTAVHPTAPPILKWDHQEERNPVAWYVYPNGSPAAQWSLIPGNWTPITAIAPMPNMWGSRPMPFLDDGITLVIEGAVDGRTDTGNALFPECLRAEMHGVRATIEAYSKAAQLAGRETASACGYDLRKGRAATCSLRALVAGAWCEYRIDRWD